MNDVINSILTRRSVRSFESTAIDEQKIQTIVDCAKASPTARNSQKRKFTVLLSTEKIQKLAKVIATELNLSGYNLYNCTALIIVSVDKDYEFGEVDSACAMENIYLSAHALGLGSVWINQLRHIFDAPAVREVLTEFKIPVNHAVWGMSAMGIPAEEPKLKERTEEVEYIR